MRDNTWRATPTYTIRRTGGVSRGMPRGCPWHALQIAGRFMGESGRPVAQFPCLHRVIVREDPFFRKNGVASTVSTVLLSLSLSLFHSIFAFLFAFLVRFRPLVLRFSSVYSPSFKIHRRELVQGELTSSLIDIYRSWKSMGFF